MSLRKSSLVRLAYWGAAATVGALAVAYAKLIGLVQGLYFTAFQAHPYAMTAATPLAFLAATYGVVAWAPEAKGSGIPQVLAAIEAAHTEPEKIWQSRLVSVRTALVKVLSSVIGVLGGASIGREGPTVQIASSAFATIGRWARRYAPKIDLPTCLVGGGAAGVAAAFNTPLAGITFALEEMADNVFGPFKRVAIAAVVIAGVTAQALSGSYLYFGHPDLAQPNGWILPQAVLIGACGGAFGGAFAWLVAKPPRWLWPKVWWHRALLCGVVTALITLLTHGDTAGSGYEITRQFMETEHGDLSLLFPFQKLATTVASYYSGMAGGIFSPSLAMGAGVGVAVAKLLQLANLKSCALLGMVAFFSGAIQAPLTGVMIVMEMTDEHMLIIPFLIAAFLAQFVGQLLLPVPLYKYLAQQMELSPAQDPLKKG